MAHIVNGDLDPEILTKPTDDELLPLTESEPAKFDQNTDLVQSLQQKSLIEEENNLPIKQTNEKEEDHTNIPGMRLRPKRNVNFKNDDFGRDYGDFDDKLRRSTRVPHKREDSDFITYKPHQAFPTEPVHNSGYSTRLRTRRGETLPFEDHKEEKKESFPVVLPREVISQAVKEKPVAAEVLPPKQVENEGQKEKAGMQIKLRKAQTKTRSYQEKISGESFIIEAIEGGNLGWKGLEEKSQKPTPAVAAPAETNRSGRTRASQRLNPNVAANGNPVEEKKEEEGYRVRLRRPGKSSSNIYKEQDEDDFEEEEEEINYGESEDDDEVVFNKKQKKQQNKQNKKQQILDFNLAQQGYVQQTVEPEPAQETRMIRAKRRITEHYKTSNIDDAAEDPDETSTKIRLTLPPAGENSEAKRYNTRAQRR